MTTATQRQQLSALAAVAANAVAVVTVAVVVECAIVHFLCVMRVFEVRASSSSPRLRLCQILFLLRPPLLR